MSGVVPSTFITDRGVAERLGRLASINTGFTDVQFRRKQEIVHIFLEYLRKEYARHCQESPSSRIKRSDRAVSFVWFRTVWTDWGFGWVRDRMRHCFDEVIACANDNG